jgi:hypothetical protein
MKLIRLYDVAKDQSFLVELADGDTKLNALHAVVQDRRTHRHNKLIQVGNTETLPRLYFDKRELKGKQVPSTCFYWEQLPVLILPPELNVSTRFTVSIEVESHFLSLTIDRKERRDKGQGTSSLRYARGFKRIFIRTYPNETISTGNL